MGRRTRGRGDAGTSTLNPILRRQAVTKRGTGTWDVGRGDVRTRGRGDVGT